MVCTSRDPLKKKTTTQPTRTRLPPLELQFRLRRRPAVRQSPRGRERAAVCGERLVADLPPLLVPGPRSLAPAPPAQRIPDVLRCRLHRGKSAAAAAASSSTGGRRTRGRFRGCSARRCRRRWPGGGRDAAVAVAASPGGLTRGRSSCGRLWRRRMRRRRHGVFSHQGRGPPVPHLLCLHFLLRLCPEHASERTGGELLRRHAHDGGHLDGEDVQEKRRPSRRSAIQPGSSKEEAAAGQLIMTALIGAAALFSVENNLSNQPISPAIYRANRHIWGPPL